MLTNPNPLSTGGIPCTRRLSKGVRDRMRLLFARLFFRAIPHCRHIGLRPVDVRGRKLTAVLPYQRKLVGDPWRGTLHGGAITTLVDQTCGAAASLSVFPANVVATLDLRLDYLRPAVPGRDVHAEAEAFRITSTIIFIRCTAHDGNADDPVAFSTGSFIRNGSFANSRRRGRRRRNR